MSTQFQVEDEAEYAEAVRELSAGTLREGLWAKSFAEAEGDRERAKSLYLKYRVALIKEEKRTRESTAVLELLSAFPTAKVLPEEVLRRFAARRSGGEDIAKEMGEIQAGKDSQQMWGCIGFFVLFLLVMAVSWFWVFVLNK